ncbi:hypothetical protein [Mediterraneibacter gnavus]|uniref:hypothetical protein n=1 Tax=Mediterraneibacter gnavus TaxID=33038 RepID=UPI003566E912
MTGENFKRIERGSDIKAIKEKIFSLQNECGKLYDECRETGVFDSVKHDLLSKEIEWQEYLLWGLRNGMIFK